MLLTFLLVYAFDILADRFKGKMIYTHILDYMPIFIWTVEILLPFISLLLGMEGERYRQREKESEIEKDEERQPWLRS